MAITFDGSAKLMTLTTGTVSVSVRELWSRWVDWFLTSDNSKYLPAFTSLGGDEITTEISVPIYAFLMNGWRIKPQEANHTLVVGDGILVVSGGGDPFVNTSGSYIVRINYQQPVQALTVATGGSTGPTVSEIVDGVLNTPNSVDTGVTLGDAVRNIVDILEALDIPIPPDVASIVDGVLNTPDSIDEDVDLGSGIRSLLTLVPLLDLDTDQAAKVAALFKRFALDAAVPVTHAETSITAGDIDIHITDNGDGTFTERRQ